MGYIRYLLLWRWFYVKKYSANWSVNVIYSQSEEGIQLCTMFRVLAAGKYGRKFINHSDMDVRHHKFGTNHSFAIYNPKPFFESYPSFAPNKAYGVYLVITDLTAADMFFFICIRTGTHPYVYIQVDLYMHSDTDDKMTVLGTSCMWKLNKSL